MKRIFSDWRKRQYSEKASGRALLIEDVIQAFILPSALLIQTDFLSSDLHNIKENHITDEMTKTQMVSHAQWLVAFRYSAVWCTWDVNCSGDKSGC